MRKTIKTIVVAVMSFVMAAVFVSCGSPSLQDYADKYNKEMPKEFAEGWVVKRAVIENNYFVFESEVDEDNSDFAIGLYDDDFLAMSTVMFKDQMLNDDGVKPILKQCKKENKGMKMIMKGKKSGKTVTLFDITPEEMQKQ